MTITVFHRFSRRLKIFTFGIWPTKGLKGWFGHTHERLMSRALKASMSEGFEKKWGTVSLNSIGDKDWGEQERVRTRTVRVRRQVSDYDAATTARMNDTSLDYKGFVHSKPKKLNSTSTLAQIRTNRHLSGDTASDATAVVKCPVVRMIRLGHIRPDTKSWAKMVQALGRANVCTLRCAVEGKRRQPSKQRRRERESTGGENWKEKLCSHSFTEFWSIKLLKYLCFTKQMLLQLVSWLPTALRTWDILRLEQILKFQGVNGPLRRVRRGSSILAERFAFEILWACELGYIWQLLSCPLRPKWKQSDQTRLKYSSKNLYNWTFASV